MLEVLQDYIVPLSLPGMAAGSNNTRSELETFFIPFAALPMLPATLGRLCRTQTQYHENLECTSTCTAWWGDSYDPVGMRLEVACNSWDVAYATNHVFKMQSGIPVCHAHGTSRLQAGPASYCQLHLPVCTPTSTGNCQ